ncbi:MAG: endonuclease NucS [Methanobacterium sp.]|jgi:hypothetical protein
MPIWKIGKKGPVKIPETKLQKEKILEKELEDWIIEDPSILGEPLLVIGRQVMIPDVKDKLDILALDSQGNAVIIELKQGKLKDPVDMQALRYASYISKWYFEDFENQARTFLGKVGDPEFNFNEFYEKFCSETGIEEVPDINTDQRIILVGSEVKEKLGSVALWLGDHNIDIKVVEVEVYIENEKTFIQPQIIIPVPVSKFISTGSISKIDISKPWIFDGKKWHLEKQCSPKIKEMLIKINDIVTDNLQVDGPYWNQKSYVSYHMNNYIWLAIHTRPNMLILDFLFVKANNLEQFTLAKNLGIVEYSGSLKDKLGLPSSVFVQKKDDSTDQIILRIKKDFNVESEAFMNFLNEVYEAFSK